MLDDICLAIYGVCILLFYEFIVMSSKEVIVFAPSSTIPTKKYNQRPSKPHIYATKPHRNSIISLNTIAQDTASFQYDICRQGIIFKFNSTIKLEKVIAGLFSRIMSYHFLMF